MPCQAVIAASGTAPLVYQWRLNGGNLTGATSSSLVLTNAQAGNSAREAKSADAQAGMSGSVSYGIRTEPESYCLAVLLLVLGGIAVCQEQQPDRDHCRAGDCDNHAIENRIMIHFVSPFCVGRACARPDEQEAYLAAAGSGVGVAAAGAAAT